MPAITIFNPPMRKHGAAVKAVLSTRAISLAYRHADSGRDYKHDFASGVTVQLLKDGSVRLYRDDGRPLHKWFDEKA